MPWGKERIWKQFKKNSIKKWQFFSLFFAFFRHAKIGGEQGNFIFAFFSLFFAIFAAAKILEPLLAIAMVTEEESGIFSKPHSHHYQIIWHPRKP
jgi:hypothetical protein